MSKKILIIGPAWVGDMVMAQGLYRVLKQRNHIIDVLAPAWTFALLKRMPEIRHQHEMPLSHGELNLAKRYKLAKQLRAYQYDQAIVLPNTFKSALIPWLANIPQRTGWLGEARFGLLNDWRILNTKRLPRMIDRFIALGLPKSIELPEDIPYPLFSVSKASQEKALVKYNLKINQHPILALAPGAAFGPSKRWPITYFAEVANHQINQDQEVWLFGGKEEIALGEELMHLTSQRCQNLIGKVPLDDTIDLFASISGLITNDSGLMHIAAALQKPTVVLYGSTSPQFTPPLSDKATVLQLSLPCQPCFKRTCPLRHHQCMQTLTPNVVMDAIKYWNDKK